MQYETREAFLTDYYRLKEHITERHGNDEAHCQYVPYDYYTIAYESVADAAAENALEFSDDDVYDEFFDDCTLEEHIVKNVTEPLIAYVYSRKCMMMIYFDENTIERYEDSEWRGTDKYLITPDGNVYDI